MRRVTSKYQQKHVFLLLVSSDCYIVATKLVITYIQYRINNDDTFNNLTNIDGRLRYRLCVGAYWRVGARYVGRRHCR